MKTVSSLIREKKRDIVYKTFNDVLLWKVPQCFKISYFENLFEQSEIDQMGTMEEKMFFSLFSAYKPNISIPKINSQNFNLIFSYFYRKFEPEDLTKASPEAKRLVQENPIIFIYTFYGDCSITGSIMEEEIWFEPVEGNECYIQIDENVIHVLDAFRHYKTHDMLYYILNNVELFWTKMY